MLMEINPLSMRGSMVMISPSRRDVSPIEQLRRSPRLVPPRFRLMVAEFCPVSLLMIFFLGRKTSYSRRWAPEACQGGHEAGGAPRGVGRAPHPRGWWVSPSGTFFAQYFLYILKITHAEFLDFWRCAAYVSNICSFSSPEFQLPASPLFM